MSLLAPNWRCFQTVSSDAEASSFSECCLFSLATLEVDCDPETHCFALTEQERPGAWRWAIISARGAILQAGCEPTQLAAKEIATEALHDRSPMTAGFAKVAVKLA
jgi:hypothetical protein